MFVQQIILTVESHCEWFEQLIQDAGVSWINKVWISKHSGHEVHYEPKDTNSFSVRYSLESDNAAGLVFIHHELQKRSKAVAFLNRCMRQEACKEQQK
jgi:hypothetical protein